ncbi:MAG: hypothetical protein ACJAYI_000211, partial [Myxococcota bacterium]
RDCFDASLGDHAKRSVEKQQPALLALGEGRRI